MEDQYNMSDLRHLIANTATSSRPHHHPHHHHHHDLIFPDPHRHITNPDHNHNHSHNQYYDMMMMSVGGGVNTAASAVQQHYQLTHDMLPREFSEIHAVATTDNNSNTATTTATTTTSALETDNIGGGDGGTGRWPRQETLTLLEIRSCLDLKFKESIQKGPLWDEVSRIMYEEHGYQRSGKKCREKFENLYKYYKKTKEGKAGRQDGKHYRFFRQLEALYGSSDQASIREKQLNMLSPGNNFQFNPAIQTINNSNNNNNNSSLSLSNNSSYYDTSSSNEDKSDNNNNSNKRRKRSWKVKIKDFIDSQMKKLMEKQELWLDKMMKTIEHREQERLFREEEWRKQELIRVEKEHKFWANERSWIEARDAALMEALHKLSSSSNRDGVDEEVLIGVANENYLMMKKRKENYYNSRSSANYDLCGYNNNNANHHNNQGLVINDGSSSSPSNSNVVGNNVQDQGCYRFFIGDGGGGGGGDGGGGDNQHNLWENYGVKLNNNGGGSSN